MVDDPAGERAVAHPVRQDARTICGVGSAEHPVDPGRGRRAQRRQLVLLAGRDHFQHHLESGVVGERRQLTLSRRVRADVLEPDVFQTGVGQFRHDLGSVFDGSVAVGEHEHEVRHRVLLHPSFAASATIDHAVSSDHTPSRSARSTIEIRSRSRWEFRRAQNSRSSS